MQYITHHELKGKSIGGEVHILRGEPLTARFGMKGEVLYYHDKPVCAVSSLIGEKHFAINLDGHGLERGDITYAIAYEPRIKLHSDGHFYRFSEAELTFLGRYYKYWLRNIQPLLFNRDFFEADIGELRKLYNLLFSEGGIKRCIA